MGDVENDAAIHWRSVNPFYVETGEAYVLRYFETTVWLPLLASFDVHQANEFLGPVEELLIPGLRSSQVWRACRGGRGVVIHEYR